MHLIRMADNLKLWKKVETASCRKSYKLWTPCLQTNFKTDGRFLGSVQNEKKHSANQHLTPVWIFLVSSFSLLIWANLVERRRCNEKGIINAGSRAQGGVGGARASRPSASPRLSSVCSECVSRPLLTSPRPLYYFCGVTHCPSVRALSIVWIVLRLELLLLTVGPTYLQ